MCFSNDYEKISRKVPLYLTMVGGIIVSYVPCQHIIIILFVTHVKETEELKKNKKKKL